MKKLIIITGASSGLGEAISEHYLREEECKIISISRRVSKKQEQLSTDKFQFISQDLSGQLKKQTLSALEENINNYDEIIFFNNAGTIEPLSEFKNSSKKLIHNALMININTPIELIHFLLSYSELKKMKFINISSGAYKQSIENWSIYSSCKAFTFRFFEILKAEFSTQNQISFISIDPGVIDTNIQDTIRERSFPMGEYFRSLKSNNQLRSATEAAAFVINQI